jgi:serine protease
MSRSALLTRALAVVAATAPLASAAVLLPAGSAVASDSRPVEVAAIIESADGRLSVVRSRATSLRGGHALARRWGSEQRVVASAVVTPVRAVASDPLRPQQWGLTRLSAEKAWEIGPASAELVAVLDTGVDAAHPDLTSVVVPGRDLVASGTATTDPHGHGTHVAGVVAAVAGNGIGGAGLAQGARILPVRVLDATGWGNDATVAQGIVWAVDNGATVVNLSLGGPHSSSLLSAAIDYAVQRDVVVVAASGNSGQDGDPVLYPAATPGVIAVGAVGQSDSHPAWSSTGSHLAVSAPGVGIVSTVPGGGHQSWSGTSMAAPFVAAAAALLNTAEPALTPAQVRTRFMETAQDAGAAGHDPLFGAGIVDVVAARAAGVPAPVAPAPVAPAPVVSEPVVSEPALSEPAPAPSPVASEPTPAPVAPEPVSEPRAPAPTAAPTTAPVTPAPTTTPSAPVRTPAITIRTSRSAGVVLPGRAVSLAARVLSDGAPRGGAPVALERRVGNGPWTVVREAVTGGDGLVAFSLRPDRGGDHRFRAGNDVSSTLRVDVRQAAALSAARTGRLVKIDARVLPGGSTTVALQVPRGRGWATIATVRTDSAGRARFTAVLPKRSKVRLHVPARPDLLAAVSPALVR